jgi:hypothetical protein
LLFAVFELTALSQAAPFWERMPYFAFPFVAWMSIAILSKLRIRRPLLICCLLTFLISFSFVAPYLSVSISYSYPELNATRVLTQYSNLAANTIGFQGQFLELIWYEDPTWGSASFPSQIDYAFFLSESSSAYNITFLNNYLEQNPTFYSSQLVVRGSRDVVFFSTVFGLNYSAFWGRVDTSLNSGECGYNRIYDSSWVQIYSYEES